MPIPPPLRRWLRFGVRSLLLLMLVVALPLGWKVNQVRAQRRAVTEIEAAGGSVQYDYQVLTNPTRLKISRGQMPTPEPAGPGWLRKILGEDFFAQVVEAHVSSTMSEQAMRTLSGLSGLQKVHLTAQTDVALESLSEVKTLRVLSSQGACSPTGLAYLPRFRELRVLQLVLPELSDAHAAALGAVFQLESLSIRCNDLTDERFERILDGMPRLTDLTVSSTQLTDRALRRLERSTELKSLCVHGSDLSQDAIDRLRATLPQCHCMLHTTRAVASETR